MDDPQGATVVVRRLVRAGDPELLLLHRAHNGPDFSGDWAWTSPSGCRLPGEPVYRSALRELAEETGIEAYDVWALDVQHRGDSGYQWALFTLDLPADQEVRLLDREHDRFEWVSPDEAVARMLPRSVAAAQVAPVRDRPFVRTTLRALQETDLGLVAGWWHDTAAAPWFGGSKAGTGELADRLRARSGTEGTTRMWIYEADELPIGFLQAYRAADHADLAVRSGQPHAVAFDYLMGADVPSGQGLGTRMVWEFCRDVLRREYPDATELMACPSHRNHRSLRVLEKCGFRQGLWIDEPAGPDVSADTQIVCTLDVRHYFGPVAPEG